MGYMPLNEYSRAATCRLIRLEIISQSQHTLYSLTRLRNDLCPYLWLQALACASSSTLLKTFWLSWSQGQLPVCLMRWINRGSTPLLWDSHLGAPAGSSQDSHTRDSKHHSWVWCYLRDSRFAWFIKTPLHRLWSAPFSFILRASELLGGTKRWLCFL